jgi:hypothetical protein
VESILWTSCKETLSLKGWVVGLYPEGMIGLSLGFTPRVLTKRTSRPEGGGRTEAPEHTLDQKYLTPPEGVSRWGRVPGVKTPGRVLSSLPDKSDSPDRDNKLTAVHEIDSTSKRPIEDEDEVSALISPQRTWKPRLVCLIRVHSRLSFVSICRPSA